MSTSQESGVFVTLIPGKDYTPLYPGDLGPPICRSMYTKKEAGAAAKSKKPKSDGEVVSKPPVIKAQHPASGVPTHVLNELKGLKDSMSSVVTAMSGLIDMYVGAQ